MILFITLNFGAPIKVSVLILCSGPDSGRMPDVFAIVYVGNTWTFTEDPDQGHVDAVDAVKWPEPKSVGFIVC